MVIIPALDSGTTAEGTSDDEEIQAFMKEIAGLFSDGEEGYGCRNVLKMSLGLCMIPNGLLEPSRAGSRSRVDGSDTQRERELPVRQSLSSPFSVD